MARVFVGNDAMVDREVLDAVKRLPDDFFVFAEFDIDRRNIDWLVIRSSNPKDEASASGAILTELKRVSAPITGTVHDEWKVDRIDGTTDTVSGGQEKNPYWQAVAAANSLRGWLWNHHRLFCEDTDLAERQEANFSIWPDVLLLGRHGQQLDHRLPVRPTTGYGMWWFDLERWLTHVQSWKPNQRDRTRHFTEKELVRLASLVGAKEIEHTPVMAISVAAMPAAPGIAATMATVAAPALAGMATTAAAAALDPLLRHLTGLESQIATLNARVAALEQALATVTAAAPVPAAVATEAVAAAKPARRQTRAAVTRAIEPEEPEEPAAMVAVPATNGAHDSGIPADQAAVLALVARGMQAAGRRAVFPAVLKELELRLGYSLKQTKYAGLGGAKAYFEQARAQGIISYGPVDESGAPTILPMAG